MSVSAEQVVLLDDAGVRIGTAAKSTVHDEATPLHLAFSCHVLGPDGRVLVSRRALGKRAWPGVWTNAFCGHPGPEEDTAAAIHRRAEFELGLTVQGVTPALPDFRYRAVDASGIVENEICPVFLAHTSAEPDPHPEEVMEIAWVEPADLAGAIARTPWAFSPWLVLQAAQLPLLAAPGAGRRGPTAEEQ
ncbi:isopentenyl-diphosphate Delta-isomerase [Bogoriella caseilytica]|uniref:Isopentenyl-diphosphate Delta-isomerase n=1 Tax=Bogoriella caseilytica TaxID=56055 RepID=A0A3N2BCN8_9MICO|nr:isopentenyl-diphosphate Delta-isomerase [Bogoriella caseilytica]ROR73021.1 isopentenyl-diphosphate delta-isomerase [Bogoriella caseilytica]